jgi:acylphosphatase
MNRIECIVTGRVQMVMYRDFAQRTARRLGVFGWVKNEDDGSVRIVAEGDELVLDKYLTALKKGSILSRVENITADWKDATKEFSDFDIRY